MSSSQPEPCLSAADFAPGVCRSPIACGGWGYCRERNRDGVPNRSGQDAWREEAALRNSPKQALAPEDQSR